MAPTTLEKVLEEILYNQKEILDKVKTLEENVSTLQEAIEEMVVVTSEDIGDNIGSQIEDALAPILEKHKEGVDNTCRKLASFLLRYAKSLEEGHNKDKINTPVPPLPEKTNSNWVGM